MRKTIVLIGLILGAVLATASNSINIPLRMYSIHYAPQDGPTGSTPDPPDPNQFYATLTGNILRIFTQKDAVSFVVIRNEAGESVGQDYYYGISYGSVACEITQRGRYYIEIGYWTTDFIGQFEVRSIGLYAMDGKAVQQPEPGAVYLLRIGTSLGTTAKKIIVHP